MPLNARALAEGVVVKKALLLVLLCVASVAAHSQVVCNTFGNTTTCDGGLNGNMVQRAQTMYVNPFANQPTFQQSQQQSAQAQLAAAQTELAHEQAELIRQQRAALQAQAEREAQAARAQTERTRLVEEDARVRQQPSTNSSTVAPQAGKGDASADIWYRCMRRHEWSDDANAVCSQASSATPYIPDDDTRQWLLRPGK
jgi:hypothetical protein